MQIIFPVIIICAAKQVNLILDEYAIVTGSRRKITLINGHDLLPLGYLHVHKVLISELRLQLLILFLGGATRHCDRDQGVLDHVTSDNITGSLSNPP